MTTALQTYLQDMLDTPSHSAVVAMAEHIMTKHSEVSAVLAYGSALRDSDPDNTLIDYYVLTQSTQGISGNPLSRVFCRVLPPNVYFAEYHFKEKTYRAKYAVLPMELLARKVSGDIANPYFWARFAQPMRLITSADAIARHRLLQIMSRAAETAQANAKQLDPQASAAVQWIKLFQNTYPTELRPEDENRAAMIVEQQQQHFETITNLATPIAVSRTLWSTRRWQGKTLSVLRLFKAAFTFQGGADYAAWKIKRHSGIDIQITEWQRRHPILASIVLLPKLLRKGALK